MTVTDHESVQASSADYFNIRVIHIEGWRI